MSKRLIKLLILTAFFFQSSGISAQKTYCLHDLKRLYSSEKFTPKKAVLLWDLHGVLSQANITEALTHAWHLPKKLNIFKAIFNMKTYTTIWNLKKAGQDCSEYYAKSLLENVESLNGHSKNDAIRFINAQHPIEKSVSILKRMGKQANANILFSNIGIDSWQNLQLKPEYSFLKEFNDAVICSDQTNWKAKPHKNAFNEVKRTAYRYNPNTQFLILIDDNLENIKAARKNGIYGIWFQNPNQLEYALREIGFI
jgi:FMN phosphatase YigB (HAD superfamily)